VSKYLQGGASLSEKIKRLTSEIGQLRTKDSKVDTTYTEKIKQCNQVANEWKANKHKKYRKNLQTKEREKQRLLKEQADYTKSEALARELSRRRPPTRRRRRARRINVHEFNTDEDARYREITGSDAEHIGTVYERLSTE
jgi:hypothetical protein